MFGEEAFFACPGWTAQQAQHPSCEVRQNPIGDIGIVVSQPLLGDARLRPKDSFGMRELDPAHISLPGLPRLFGALLWCFKADVLRGLVFPQALERGLPDQSVMRP